MANRSTEESNSLITNTQFLRLTADRVQRDYKDGLITAEGYILYLLDIHSFGVVGWVIDADIALTKWSIPKKTYYRVITKLKDNNFIKFSKSTGRMYRYKISNQEIETHYSEYQKFLKSDYWLEVRELVLKRDDYTCQVCGYTKDLQVHHLTYEHHKHEKEHLDDLVTLCKHCHKKEHQY